MQLVAFVQMCSACFGTLGSIFFAIGVLRQTPETIAKLAANYYDDNPYRAPEMAAQKAEYTIGAVLLGIAFFVQFASFLIPAEQHIFNGVSICLIATVTFALSVVAFFPLQFVARLLKQRYVAAVKGVEGGT